jgi:lipopolysaccharide/colanic/teichoic acid biosynthesis glycosyltransferase
LIGANRFAASFIQLLQTYSSGRQSVVAVLDKDPAMLGRAISGVQVLGAPHELDAIIAEFSVHGVNTGRIVIAGEADLLSPTVMLEVERICRKRQIQLSFLPRMIGITEQNPTSVNISSEPSEARSFSPPTSFLGLKRGFDIVASFAMLVLLSPLLLVAGLLVLLDVGRPVLFWQERIGWKGHTFLIYKFRTLGAPFDSAGNPTLAGRRPSAIGRFLRETRVDELPQLFNVLLGEMSLIGPRPLLPEDQPSKTSVRLSVRPGISGWAQVNGGKLVTKEHKEKLDEWYLHNMSLWVDMQIVVMTIRMVLLRGNASSSEESLADSQQVQGKNLKLQHSVYRGGNWTAVGSNEPQSNGVLELEVQHTEGEICTRVQA